MFNHEELQVFFRDKIVPFNQATLSIANTGFMYGLGVFSGIRAHINEEQKKLYIFRPEEHFIRLRNACRMCYYENFLNNFSYERFLKVLVDLLLVNKMREDVYIRVQNFTDENRVTPKFVTYKDSFCAFLYPLGDYVPTGGMRCTVSSWDRINDNAIPARGKINGAYVNTAFAKTEAIRRGYDEAIFLNQHGNVVEGSAENFFIIRNGDLITPPASDNILEGITRKSVMEIAADLGIKVIERSISRSELYFADEIFLTGTGAKVSPVTEIDGVPISSGVVGPISEKLQETYFAAARGELERYKKWLVPVEVG